MCVQPVLSATDLLHVPLKLLDQNLQLTDALVRFVSCAAQRPGLNKDQINPDLNLLEIFLHKLGCYDVHICDEDKKKKPKEEEKVDSTAKITILNRKHAIAAVDPKAKTNDDIYLACHLTVFLFEVISALFQPLTFTAQKAV